MKKLKHNKIRNTGLIFDMLIRKLTSSILTETKNIEDIPAYNILKKYYKGETELSKEFSLYNLVNKLKEQNTKLENPEYIIDNIISIRKELNENKLIQEKYKLINEIKKCYDINNFFKVKVDNFKLNASLYKIFENKPSENPHEYLESKMYIQEHLLNKNVKRKSNKTDERIKYILNQEKDIKQLTYKMLVEEFEREMDTLSPKQAQFLKSYVFEDITNKKFKSIYTKRLDECITQIKEAKKIIKNDVLPIKLNEISKILNKVKRTSVINEHNIITILKSIKLYEDLLKLKMIK